MCETRAESSDAKRRGLGGFNPAVIHDSAVANRRIQLLSTSEKLLRGHGYYWCKCKKYNILTGRKDKFRRTGHFARTEDKSTAYRNISHKLMKTSHFDETEIFRRNKFCLRDLDFQGETKMELPQYFVKLFFLSAVLTRWSLLTFCC